ncbi:MAG: MBL fold metallo-hydrolase [Bradymonadaceae bacterium]
MQNAYLVDDGELTLVDAGMPWDVRRLRRYLRRAGYRPEDLERVLVTHYDLDHVGTLGRLGGDAPAYMGRRDLALARGERSPPLAHHKGAFHRGLRRLYPLPGGLDVGLRRLHVGFGIQQPLSRDRPLLDQPLQPLDLPSAALQLGLRLRQVRPKHRQCIRVDRRRNHRQRLTGLDLLADVRNPAARLQ